jgi:DNA repair exonuclease SbcCD ATPase subunit
MLDENLTAIIVAILSGAIPGFFALRQSHRTKRSVELAGSEVTVANWNKLIKNLYGEIDRLTVQNERDRKRAIERENELQAELESTKLRSAQEKAELLAEIRLLREKLSELEGRVTKTLTDDTDRAAANQAANDERTSKQG